MPEGYIYILTNPSFRLNRYKIGLTTRSPSERAQELSSATGVPEPFEVAYEKKVSDCYKAERSIKEKLEHLRISKNREFYEIKLADAVDILHNTANEVGGILSEESSSTIKPDLKDDTEPPETIMNTTSSMIESELDIHIPPERKAKSTGTKKAADVTIEDHLSVCHESIRQLFKDFSTRVKQIHPAIKEKILKKYVAYEAKQNFIEMYFRSNRLEVCLRPGKYNDPKGLLGFVPDSYKWTLTRRFLLEGEGQIDYLIDIVKQSYEDVM